METEQVQEAVEETLWGATMTVVKEMMVKTILRVRKGERGRMMEKRTEKKEAQKQRDLKMVQ